MIITGLHARNVLKYRELDLEELPREGIIGISGPNESGKSTIGETICFALFGRTWSLDENNRRKIIRWGEDRCLAAVSFIASDGREYQVSRHLDSDGNHSARLSFKNDDQAIAKGAEPVRLALGPLLGVKYEEFIESFYLAQRELTAPHPHSDAIKSMAGILTLEKTHEAFDHEIENLKSSMVNADARHIRIQEDIEELEIEPDRLAQLESEAQELQQAHDSCLAESEELRADTQDFIDSIDEYRSASNMRSRYRSFELLFLLFGAIAALAWIMLTYYPGHDVSKALDGVLHEIPMWNSGDVKWLLYIAAGLGVFAVLTWMGTAGTGEVIDAFADKSDGYVSKIEAVIERRNEGRDLEIAGVSADELDTAVDEQHTVSILAHLKQRDATRQQVEVISNQECGWLDNVASLQQEKLEHLGVLIEAESELVTRADGMKHEQESYRRTIEDNSRNVRVRALANQLIEGAMERVAKRFNRELRDGAGNILPRLTQDSYQHIKLDNELDVQVFSADKGDFMEFDEISSGTQRQVQLAVRLSMSQALARDSVKGDQFLFLDEPFAFFDDERTSHSLKTMHDMQYLPQVWIIAQEFPEEASFARQIICNRRDLDLKSFG
ncbi:MAG: AAA family ATPase [Gammaproteobacteria bacterium]|jgi:DNA repair protein SbcC/Rad50